MKHKTDLGLRLLSFSKQVVRTHLSPHLTQLLRRMLLRQSRTVPLERQSNSSTERQSPLVSVVIPCYNYGCYVTKAIDSVLVQTLQDLEVIVVDDGSTDPKTVAVLNGLRHPRVTVIRQANSGLPAARNAGIGKARGYYICCLDADDALEPTYLEKCISLLESNPGIGIAYSWLLLEGDRKGVWESADLDPAILRLTNHVIVSAVYRRADWERSGGYWVEMRGGYEDWEFWLRMASLGIRGVSIPEPLFRHYRHGRTMTHEANGQAVKLARRMRDRNSALFESRAFRKKIESGYVDVQLDQPFAHLAKPHQFRQPIHGDSILVLVGAGEVRVVEEWLRALMPGKAIFLVTDETDHAWPGIRLEASCEAVYRLPNFLATRDWLPFVDHLVSTRRIDTVLRAGECFANAVEWLRERHPDLTIHQGFGD